MKKLLRVLGIVLVTSIIVNVDVPFTTVSEVMAIEEIVDVTSLDEEFYRKQSESIEQYQNMLTSFNSINRTRESNSQYYDENYGGAYINEYGELVVLLVDNGVQEINEIVACTENDSIITKQCTYSFNQLLEVINTINDNLSYLLEKDVIIAEMYEDIYDNCVKIGVRDLTDEKEKIIRNLINEPYMDIYEQNNFSEQNIAIKGGDGITSSDNGGSSTVGFCATRGGTEGFVIAGHAGNTMYENFTVSGTTIGYVTATAYYNRTTADASFLTKGSNASTTHMISAFSCHYLATSETDLPVGAQIWKYGISTQQTSGYILSNYCTEYFDEKQMYFINQTSADYSSSSGDSGGPVYMIMDVVHGSVTCKLLGIHRGRNSNGDAVFSKYYNIVNELGVTAITN